MLPARSKCGVDHGNPYPHKPDFFRRNFRGSAHHGCLNIYLFSDLLQVWVSPLQNDRYVPVFCLFLLFAYGSWLDGTGAWRSGQSRRFPKYCSCDARLRELAANPSRLANRQLYIGLNLDHNGRFGSPFFKGL